METRLTKVLEQHTLPRLAFAQRLPAKTRHETLDALSGQLSVSVSNSRSLARQSSRET